MIAYLFFLHMVHWSFILGQVWVLSKHFCKACQNCLHPSFVIVHKAVRMHYYCFVVIAPANAIMQHKQRQLGQSKFWHVLQNWLLCSHPWPNFCYIFFFFEKCGVKPGFLFTTNSIKLLTQNLGEKVILTCFYKNACWAVICYYAICMTNVSYKREIII